MTSHQYKSLCCKLLIETSKNPVNTNWLFTILKDFYFLFRLHNFTLKGHLIKFLRQYDHQFVSQSGFNKCLPMLKFSNLTGIYIPDSKCFWVQFTICFERNSRNYCLRLIITFNGLIKQCSCTKYKK